MLQLSARNIILLVGSVLALFLSVFFLIKFPEYSAFYHVVGIILAFVLIIFASKEVALFFVLPYCFSGLVLIEFAPEGSWPYITASMATTGAVCAYVFSHLRNKEKKWQIIRRETQKLEKLFKELSVENSEWKSSYIDVSEQSEFQNSLLSMVQRLVEVLDANGVKKRLLKLIEETFPGMTYSIKSVGSGADMFDHWVYQRKVPLLIRDIGSDSRFPVLPRQINFKSMLAAPILFQREVYEIIRIESNSKSAFHMSHLRVIELLSLMTSIAIDNINLLGAFKDKAVHDGFTGLINHKYFLERLEQELLYAGRYKKNLGLIMIDIDHFKKFNDSFGHYAGDEVIKKLVKVITSKLRDVDIVARYGGEEFSALMPEVTYEDLYAAAESIRQAFSAEKYSFSGTECSATISAGISIFPKDASTAPQLVRWADQRLYQAKMQGRNRVIG